LLTLISTVVAYQFRWCIFWCIESIILLLFLLYFVIMLMWMNFTLFQRVL